MATTSPEAGEAAAEDYQAYQTIVQAVSAGIQRGVQESLKALSDPSELTSPVTELMAEAGEAAPDPAEVQRLYDGFWKLATGLSTSLQWRSISGVQERSYMNVAEIQPVSEVSSAGTTQKGQETGEQAPEFSIGVSAFGVGLGVSW